MPSSNQHIWRLTCASFALELQASKTFSVNMRFKLLTRGLWDCVSCCNSLMMMILFEVSFEDLGMNVGFIALLASYRASTKLKMHTTGLQACLIDYICGKSGCFCSISLESDSLFSQDLRTCLRVFSTQKSACTSSFFFFMFCAKWNLEVEDVVWTDCRAILKSSHYKKKSSLELKPALHLSSFFQVCLQQLYMDSPRHPF